MMKWLIGPELIWLMLYFLATLLAKSNAPEPHNLNNFIENLFIWVPLAVLLTFSLWHVPMVEKNWLLTRVCVVGLIGGHYVLDAGLRAHSQQGPGIGMVYILGMGLVFAALIVGSIYVKIRF